MFHPRADCTRIASIERFPISGPTFLMGSDNDAHTHARAHTHVRVTYHVGSQTRAVDAAGAHHSATRLARLQQPPQCIHGAPAEHRSPHVHARSLSNQFCMPSAPLSPSRKHPRRHPLSPLTRTGTPPRTWPKCCARGFNAGTKSPSPLRSSR